jgi:hypothetical protein
VRTLSILVGAALVVWATLARASETRTEPTLRAASYSPLILRGAKFRPLEHVRLTVSADGNRTKKVVRASRRGSFTVPFPSVAVDRCSSGVSALAVGLHGSRARLKLPQLLCPPRSP